MNEEARGPNGEEEPEDDSMDDMESDDDYLSEDDNNSPSNGNDDDESRDISLIFNPYQELADILREVKAKKIQAAQNQMIKT